VNVGISADTAQFAVASIRNWWYSMAEPQHLLFSYIWANKIVEFSQMI
jgi:hypothetical protein